jgi:hypothetical protein
MAASVVWEALHLEKTNLVETTCENVHNMAIVSGPFRQLVVELEGFLVVLDVVSVDVVVGTDLLLELGAYNHARAFGGWTTSEKHDASARVLEASLQQPYRNRESDASTSYSTLIIRDGPRISLKAFEYICELELALLNR